MNAIEFVRDNKWLLEDNMIALREIVDESKDYKYFCLNNALGHSYSNHGGGPALLIDDLKQIIDAFELVESVGGWNNATALYDECLDADLKKAIELMEKCQ